MRTRAQLLTIVDFNAPVVMRHAYASAAASHTNSTSTDNAEEADVREGMGLITGRGFQAMIGSNELPIATVGQGSNHEIYTQTIGSDMETVIRDGFKDPVISRLPYRMATKLQRMTRHDSWQIHGEYLVGVPRRRWLEVYNPPLSLYKLDLLSSD